MVKYALNGCIFEGHRLDVYFGEVPLLHESTDKSTPLSIEKKYLEPPVLQKNWLISPPGSPQEGWIQIEEDPPNSVTLHEDIQLALDRLAQQLEQEEEDAADYVDGTKGHVILDTTSLGGLQVVVHDWDSMDESDDGLGLNIRDTRTNALSLGKTPRPPVESD